MPRKRNKTTRELNRVQAIRLYCEGFTQYDIAQELGITQQQVSADIAVVRRRWAKASLEHMDRIKSMLLAKIDDVEHKATLGWEKSLGDKTTRIHETVESEHGSVKRGKRIENRDGNPKFLDIMLKCIAQRANILGIHEALDESVAKNRNVNAIVICEPNRSIEEANKDSDVKVIQDFGSIRDPLIPDLKAVPEYLEKHTKSD